MHALQCCGSGSFGRNRPALAQAFSESSAAGGRFVVRGNPAAVFEMGMDQRVVMIEFDSVEQAIAAHDGPGYQAALKELKGGVEREIRIVEALA
jgi:uncharacterized protein (DUF1330 family)